MTLPVVFAPEAEDQLDELYDWIADQASPDVAERYVDRVIEHCESLPIYPFRGRSRDDIRPGLRTTTFGKRTVIAFAVTDEVVLVVGIFHGGRDYESVLGRR